MNIEDTTSKSATQQRRERGMKELEKGTYRRALITLFDARDLGNNENPVEQALTANCIGQVLYVMGKRTDARVWFRRASTPLCGHTPHELENLVWRLKVELLPVRLILAPCGLQLAYKARDPRLLALIFGLGYSRWITLHIIG